MIAIFIIAMLAPLPVCRLITLAREDGYRGAIPMAVWTVESCAAQLLRLGAFLREWHEFIASRKETENA